MKKHRRCRLLLALLAGLTAGAALAADFFLPNGAKVQGEAQGNRLVLMSPSGPMAAPDGQYRMSDGRILTVRAGVIVPMLEAPGAARAIGPKPDDPMQARPGGAMPAMAPPGARPLTAAPAGGGFTAMQPVQMQAPAPQMRAVAPPMQAPAAPMQAVAPAMPGPAGQLQAQPAANRAPMAAMAPPMSAVAPAPLTAQPAGMMVPPAPAMQAMRPLAPAAAAAAVAAPASGTAADRPGQMVPGGVQPAALKTAATATTTAPMSAAAALTGDPKAQLAAIKAQNKRLHAMADDLRRRIASKKDDRQMFCADYEISSNKQGVQRYCFPFACNMDSGSCYTSATNSEQCALGELWDGGAGCVPATSISNDN